MLSTTTASRLRRRLFVLFYVVPVVRSDVLCLNLWSFKNTLIYPQQPDKRSPTHISPSSQSTATHFLSLHTDILPIFIRDVIALGRQWLGGWLARARVRAHSFLFFIRLFVYFFFFVQPRISLACFCLVCVVCSHFFSLSFHPHTFHSLCHFPPSIPPHIPSPLLSFLSFIFFSYSPSSARHRASRHAITQGLLVADSFQSLQMTRFNCTLQ